MAGSWPAEVSPTMTELAEELFKNNDSDEDLTLLSVRVKVSQRSKIEQLSQRTGCSLAEAARKILDEGLARRDNS